MVSTIVVGRRGAKKVLRLGLLSSFACAGFGCDREGPSAPSAVATRAVAGDRAALAALYEATHGERWKADSAWLTNAPLEEWHGVETDAAGRVVGLNLRENGLLGTIPPEVGNLSALKQLNLQRNELYGPFPLQLLQLGDLEVLNLRSNRLSGPIPAELATLTSLRTLNLSWNQHTGRIPTELGTLLNLERLNLMRNAMTGPIPPELGNLSKLEFLSLGGVTGTVPPELGRLANSKGIRFVDSNLTGTVPTTWLGLQNLSWLILPDPAKVCIPGTKAFAAWLAGIEFWRASLCNAEDIVVLDRLFATTDGPVWTSSRGWPDPGPAIDRYGVVTDTTGRVVAIDLEGNGLLGALPEELGNLSSLRTLRLGNNTLFGELPANLADTDLRELSYNRTNLCVSPDDAVQEWLRTIAVHDGTGTTCGNRSDREVLELLYMFTGGRHWQHSRNWRSRRPLAEWAGVETDAAGRVVGLRLRGFGLAGPVPSVLGDLSELRTLDFAGNQLYGPLPPELGKLRKLEVLDLVWNISDNSAEASGAGITGPLPLEMGDMANLREARLAYNRINGAIPRSLGNLARLEHLDLSENNLTGAVPSELGQARAMKELRFNNNSLSGALPGTLGGLAELELLDVANNTLDGPLPPELGRLAKLQVLQASGNRLAGPIPPEFEGLVSLERLIVARNADMAGPLPSELLALRLEELLVGGTELCLPKYAAYWKWIESIRRRYVRRCAPEEIAAGAAAFAYLTQAVQSRSHPVPLIAGRNALLRVFLATGDPRQRDGVRGDARRPNWPAVEATFFLDGAEVHATGRFSAEADLAPSHFAEDILRWSANIEVPARIVQPGLEMTVDLDFAGSDESWPCCKRIPQQGRQPVDVRVAPPLHLTMIPVLSRTAPDSSVLDAARNARVDSELLADLRTLAPVGDLIVEVRDPYWTSSSEPVDIHREIEAVRIVEGDRAGHHYIGLFNLPDHIGGLAYIPGRTSLSSPDPIILAHEVMHNFNIWHAPCYKGSIDAGYPHADGVTGAVGYDHRTGTLVPATAFDFMGNFEACKPVWVSEYNFTQALRYRMSTQAAPAAQADVRTPGARGLPTSRARQSLLVWGGRSADGSPFLEPAFVVDAPASMPATDAGAWQIVAGGLDGQTLFSFRFDMREVDHGNGEAGFAFAVPAKPEWAEALADLTLTGPGGSTSIGRGDSDARTALLLRDIRSGQVKSILRDGRKAAELAGAPTPRAQVSSGIPSPSSWRR